MSRSTLRTLVAVLAALALPATAAPPANDTCAAATTISGTALPYTQTVGTTEATSNGDPAVSCTTPAPGKSVWYTFKPQTSDTYVFDTYGSAPTDYQPVLSLYTGDCGGLTPVANGCARNKLVVPLTAGTTYRLLVAGAAVVVDPTIKIALNGFDLCPGGAGPGGGECGSTFTVRVGDQLSARAYNLYNDTMLTAGTFAWNLGANAEPPTATGPSVPFKYTAPVASTNVVLTWTPPGQSPITRQVTMVVEGTGATSAPLAALSAPSSLAAGETAVLPSPGGTLRLTVQRDMPTWRFTYVIPSVASTKSAAGIPFVSDLSIANTETTETSVGLELWTASGQYESSLIKLPAGGSRTIADVVKTTFGLEQTFGTLLVSSTGYVSAGARTWAPVAGGGTNGQFAIGGDARNNGSAAVLLTGEVGILSGIRQDSAFRTNVGVYNLTAMECLVEVEVRDDTGRVVGSKLVLTVPPTRYVQESLAGAVGNNLPSGSVAVTNTTEGCRVGSVAYVIDNVTQDPYAVAQRKKP